MIEALDANLETPVWYDRDPNSCPVCHKSIHPQRMTAVVLGVPGEPDSTAELRVIFQCPSRDCREVFIGYYSEYWHPDRQEGSGTFNLSFTRPTNPEQPKVFEGIAKLSPRFPAIYAQALAAETYELPEVAGGGLRKALEFLITDFCISGHPEKKSAITKLKLGERIGEYVDDDRIKAMAKRTAWLGNDELHYERQWEDRDLQDLKMLLGLTLSWIETNIRTAEYEESMVRRPRKEE